MDVRAPLRQAAVDLHRRQMRSPAHSLANGAAQTRQSLVLGSASRSAPGFLWSSCVELSCISSPLGRERAAHSGLAAAQ